MSTTTQTNGRELAVAMNPDQIDYGNPARPIIRHTTEDIERMAKRAAKSRMYGMDEDQAFTLMMICEAEGLHPIEALRRYHIIQGRPALRAEVVLADMMRRGWEVTWTSDPGDGARQEATFRHRTRCPDGKTVGFTMEDAKKAGITAKDNWRNWPSAMLRARVNTIACRMLDPGIIAGTYSVEEVEDMGPDCSAPPPRPQFQPQSQSPSPLRSALDDARRGPVAAPPAEHSSPSTDFGHWVELKTSEAWGVWRDAAKAARIEPGRAITRYQVANGLISMWCENGELDESEVQTDGKRDKHKVALQLAAAWGVDPAAFRADVEHYLAEKLTKLAVDAGIPLPGMIIEEAAEVDRGDAWEPPVEG